MFEPSTLIRPHIQDMPPYEPIVPFEILSQQLGMPAGQIVKLDANENPYGTLPVVTRALAEMQYTHIYPDPDSRLLRLALAEYYNLPSEYLLAGAGADELIDLVFRLLIEPGDRVINCPPTFGMYTFDADLNRAQVISVPRKQDFSINLDAIKQAIEAHKPKLIFLASPNNPDGSLVPQQQIEQLLNLPLVVVLDEAYVEFATPNASVLNKVPEYTNLIVLRTFSKWAGLAGLRVGFGAFPANLTPHLWKIKQPYTVSVAASTAAMVALQHKAELVQIGERIIQERERLFNELTRISWIDAYPSQANYILCRIKGREASTLKRDLAAQGILVRYFNKPGLSDHIRISVGKPEHTDKLIQALREME